jgi:hypothetical protein
MLALKGVAVERARFFDAEVEEGQVDAFGTDAAVFKCFHAIVVPDR